MRRRALARRVLVAALVDDPALANTLGVKLTLQHSQHKTAAVAEVSDRIWNYGFSGDQAGRHHHPVTDSVSRIVLLLHRLQ